MEQYTNDEVVEIGKSQRTIIWLILASVIEFVFPPMFIIIFLIRLFFVYMLVDELKLKSSWAWCIGMFLPLINVILLVILNSKATAAIRSKGVKVGLMGANKAQLNELAATN